MLLKTTLMKTNSTVSLHITKPKRIVHLAILAATIALSPDLPAQTGPYFGQTPPGTNPVVFAPGVLSLTTRFENRIAFSPDGKQCFFTVTDSRWSYNHLYCTTQDVNGVWSPQVPAPFLPNQDKLEPFFSQDGAKLFFTCLTNNQTDFYAVDCTPQGWTNPAALPSPINSAYNEYCYSQTTNGTAYFASTRSGGLNIYKTYQVAGQPLQVVNLAPTIVGGDPCIAPDERFLVFYTGGAYGGVDLFVSFNNRKGGWTTPVNLGSRFNTSADEFNPSISPDGQYLFFARQNASSGDVYWVSVAAIDNLNPLPTISTNPVSQTALPGDNITFNVVAGGPGPLRYQWWLNQTNSLPSATNSTLTLTNVQLADAGFYTVVVTNTVGAITSSPALLMADPAFVKLGTASPGALSFRSWIGVPFDLECSDDLSQWSSITTLTNLTGTLQYTDGEALNYSRRFYRAAVSTNY
jgi:Immunoglobulin domain/WD40-like Beta Propeller Repeat